MAWWDGWASGAPWTGPDCANGGRCDQSIPLDVGTPITSPVNGVVLPDGGQGFYAAYGRKPWGGEVDILTYLPQYGGWRVVDLIHFDTLNVQPWTTVQPGDVLGTSGGQTSGGNWPVENPPPPAPPFSTGPHIGVGVRSYQGFSPDYDPSTLLSGLPAIGSQSSAPTASDLQSLGISPPGGFQAFAGQVIADAGGFFASAPIQQGAAQAGAAVTSSTGCSIGPVQLPQWVCTWLGQPQRLLLLLGGAIVLLVGVGVFLVGILAAPAGAAAEVVGAATGQPEVAAAGRAVRAARQGRAGPAATHAARAYRARQARQKKAASP